MPEEAGGTCRTCEHCGLLVTETAKHWICDPTIHECPYQAAPSPALPANREAQADLRKEDAAR